MIISTHNTHTLSQLSGNFVAPIFPSKHFRGFSESFQLDIHSTDVIDICFRVFINCYLSLRYIYLRYSWLFSWNCPESNCTEIKSNFTALAWQKELSIWWIFFSFWIFVFLNTLYLIMCNCRNGAMIDMKEIGKKLFMISTSSDIAVIDKCCMVGLNEKIEKSR